MNKVIYLFTFFLMLFANNIYSNQESITAQGVETEISQENMEVYTVTEMFYWDDDGYNDEILFVLGNKEICLTVRWYTGVHFSVGEQVSVLRDGDTLNINGNIFEHESGKFYMLR